MGRNVEQTGRRANPALIAESGSSHAGLARRVNELAAKQGLELRKSLSHHECGSRPSSVAHSLPRTRKLD
ncbi:MAG: hypothetical protein ACJ786_14890 [Catenulispora sp.]